VVQGASKTFNPSLADATIAAQRAADPTAAAAEWDAEFRSDIGAFLDDELIVVLCARCVRSCRKRSVGAFQHLALGRRSTQQVQTNRVKCDVVDSKLRFNCVSTRPKAGQMVRLLLRLLQEARQCFTRAFVRCE